MALAGVRSPPTDADWSKFLKRLGISQSQLSAGSSEFDKICVLIDYHSTEQPYEFSPHCCVYVIDSAAAAALNTSPRPQPLEPLIYWENVGVRLHAFAMLGSKLFLFGGMGVFDGYLNWGNSMRYYDMETRLSSPITTPVRIYKQSSESFVEEEEEKEFFIEGPRMSVRKVCPRAAVMGDSKICVFGKILYVQGRDSSLPNFELLCTTTTSSGRLSLKWKKLPEPLIYSELDDMELSSVGKSVTIRSYCVHGSCLIIKINGHGVYGINVDRPHPKWVTLDGSKNSAFPLNGMFAMVDRRMLFDDYNMVKWAHLSDHFPFEVTSNRGFHLATSRKSATYFDDRCNAFCLAQAAFPFPKFQIDDRPPTSNPRSYLLLDIVKFDAEALSQFEPDEPPDSPKLKSNKSFTFQLPKNSFSERIEITACLPIMNAYRNNESVAEVDQGKRKKKKKIVAEVDQGKRRKKKTSVAEVDQGKRKKGKNQGNMKKKLKMTNMKSYEETEVS